MLGGGLGGRRWGVGTAGKFGTHCSAGHCSFLALLGLMICGGLHKGQLQGIRPVKNSRSGSFFSFFFKGNCVPLLKDAGVYSTVETSGF